MASTTHKAYSQTATSILTTELNSLANNTASSSSSAIDNTSALDLFMDIELVVAAQGVARSSGAYIAVYMSHALDGTNYDDTNTTTGELAATFLLDATTTARRRTIRDIAIPPGLFKLWAYNATGQALAASGNTVKYRLHSVTTA